MLGSGTPAALITITIKIGPQLGGMANKGVQLAREMIRPHSYFLQDPTKNRLQIREQMIAPTPAFISIKVCFI